MRPLLHPWNCNSALHFTPRDSTHTSSLPATTHPSLHPTPSPIPGSLSPPKRSPAYTFQPCPPPPVAPPTLTPSLHPPDPPRPAAPGNLAAPFFALVLSDIPFPACAQARPRQGARPAHLLGHARPTTRAPLGGLPSAHPCRAIHQMRDSPERPPICVALAVSSRRRPLPFEFLFFLTNTTAPPRRQAAFTLCAGPTLASTRALVACTRPVFYSGPPLSPCPLRPMPVGRLQARLV